MISFVRRYPVHIIAVFAVTVGFLVPFLTRQNDNVSKTDQTRASLGGEPTSRDVGPPTPAVSDYVTVKTFNVRVKDAEPRDKVYSDFGIDPRSAYAAELERVCDSGDMQTHVSKAFDGKRFVVHRAGGSASVEQALEDGARQGVKDGVAKLNPSFAFAPRLVGDARIRHQAAQGDGDDHYIADILLPCGFEISFEANLIDLP